MRKAIIHISDLHVSFHKNSDGEPISKCISWLDTNPTNAHSELFIDSAIDFIKDEYPDTNFLLIITGDIADQAHEEEYKSANTYLTRIKEKLCINNDSIIIIPGDHDVNRFDCTIAYKENTLDNGSKLAYEYHDEKFFKFKQFYETFFNSKKNFNPTNAIVDYKLLKSEKIIFIGLNSNFKIGSAGGKGFIENEKLNEELSKLLKPYDEYSKIAVFHHNFIANYDDKAIGQWEKDNYVQVLKTLEKFKFKCFIYGNEHTAMSSCTDSLYHLIGGSFSCKDPLPSFKVYTIENGNGLSFQSDIFKLQNDNNNKNHVFGYWAKLSKAENEINSPIVLVEPWIISTGQAINESHQLPEADFDVISKSTLETSNHYKKNEYRDALFKIVKEKKLFHTGHFHWSETSRAHNWIDISKILNSKEDLDLAKNSILDVIKDCNLSEEFDFIIGLGIEGNILSTRASVKYNKPYSYLPYSYRYDEHNDFEKQLNFTNNGEYSTVLIITDVVHDGRTLRKLINKRETAFFKYVKRIIVISLFYTGANNSNNSSILNTSKITDFNLSDDHNEERIEYYFVLQLKVEECPYGENFRHDCIVVKENLGCVYKFYDEEKAKEKLIKKQNRQL